MAKQPVVKEGFFKKLKQIFSYVHQANPKVIWYVIGAFALPILISIPLMFVFNNYIFPEIFGILIGLILGLMVLSRSADKIGYDQVMGKPGAAGAVLRAVNQGGWDFPEEPIYINQSTQDLIFRGTGRAGVVLVSEGKKTRIKQYMDKEENKIKRILPNVRIIKIYSGEEEDQVSIKKLRKTILKLKPVLTKTELTKVQKRLIALGGFNLSIPKGIDPMKMRMSHKNVR